jgi:hypothetical protein
MIGVIVALVLGTLVGLLVCQIISGTVMDRTWKVFATRNTQPGRYWFAIATPSIIIAIWAYAYFFFKR